MNVRGGSIILYTPKIPKNYSLLVCVWKKLKNQLILLFSLFFLLFMGSIALFGTIHGSHCIISTNFYFYLQYFQQKVFKFQQNQRIPNKPLVFIIEIVRVCALKSNLLACYK